MMSLKLSIIYIALLLGCVAPGRCDLQSRERGAFATNRVLVKFKDSSDSDTISAYGLSQRSTAAVGSRGTKVLDIIDGTSVEDKVKELRERDDVEIVEPDYIVQTTGIPNDASYTKQWHLEAINAPLAWDASVGDAGIKVCIIDSGVRMDHPDLAGNILTGWNMVPKDQITPGPKPTPGTAAYKNFNDTMGHGTHTAGIVAAVGNNSIGVAGTSWKTSLLVCRFIYDNGAGYISDAITCMDLCKSEGAHIYSNSWGGLSTPSLLLNEEINDINRSGGLFIVAAGNDMGQDLDASPVYPAAYKADNVLTVAASTTSNTLASYSNFGATTVHLAAPGSSILSTKNTLGYGTMTGTSMSAPMVAGAAAVLQSIAKAAGKTLTPRQIRDLLVKSVTPMDSGVGRLVSGGRLNFGQAVLDLKGMMTTTSEGPIYTGRFTIVNPLNTTHPYLASATDGTVYMSDQVKTWSQYVDPATGNSLFKNFSGRFLSSDGSICSKLVTFTTSTSPYRQFKLRKTTKVDVKYMIAPSCTTRQYLTSALRLSDDKTAKAKWLIRKYL